VVRWLLRPINFLEASRDDADFQGSSTDGCSTAGQTARGRLIAKGIYYTFQFIAQTPPFAWSNQSLAISLYGTVDFFHFRR
jgi:hypothetical protein